MPTPSDKDFLYGVLGAPSAEYEPQRSNNALFYINNANFGGVGNGQEALKLALASFPLPKNETEQIAIPYLNEIRKFAGRTMFDNMTVAFHDYVSRDVAKVLWAWKYKIYDPRTGIRGLKANYVRNGYIDVFGPDGSNTVTYTVEGLWPASLDFGDIDMGSDDPVRIVAQFAVDKCYIKDGDGLTGLPAPAAVNSVSGTSAFSV